MRQRLPGQPDGVDFCWVRLCGVNWLIFSDEDPPELGDHGQLAKDLKLIYAAAAEAAAAATLEAFAAAWKQRYPAIIRLWRAHWAEFTPFLAFPPEVRRVIYTNLIESMNARLRKVIRNRGRFPSEQAALKVPCLAVRNLEEFRTTNTGIRSSGWTQALQAFTIYFDGRIPTP
jgi:putative transposase